MSILEVLQLAASASPLPSPTPTPMPVGIMEQVKQFVPIAQVGSVLLAAFSVLIAAWGLFRAAKINRRQTNAQILLDCVKRYEKIVEDCPLDAWLLRFNSTQVPAVCQTTTKVMLRYLNLCSEEFYLKSQGYFSEEIWKIWDDLFKRTLRSALLRREWAVLKSEFASDKRFTNYVEEAQKLNASNTSQTPGEDRKIELKQDG